MRQEESIVMTLFDVRDNEMVIIIPLNLVIGICSEYIRVNRSNGVNQTVQSYHFE
jgi:hypothetical protein